MGKENIREYLFMNVISKIRMNDLTGKYTLFKEDYIFLDLNEDDMNELKSICYEYDIDIDLFPDRLSPLEARKMFVRYGYLKSEFNKSKDESLLKEMIQIKQEIALGYMEKMYMFISKQFAYLLNENDNEDIYQTGYEILLFAIDNYDVTRGISFYRYIQYALFIYVNEKIWKDKRNINISQARDIALIFSEISKNDLKLSMIDVELLQQKTNISESRLRSLLPIITGEHEVSMEELTDCSIYSRGFEDALLDKIERDNLGILVETLPDIQKQVIKLYYGFDGEEHTNEEIANILGYNSYQRIMQIKEKALITLSLSIYSNSFESFSENRELLDERAKVLGKMYRERRGSELFEQIIAMYSKELLIQLIEDFPLMYKEVLELYYGLKDGIRYTVDEISKMLGKKWDVIKQRIIDGNKRIALKINQNNLDSNVFVINYLNAKSKKRVK